MKIGLVMPVGWGEIREYLPDDFKKPVALEFPFGSKMAVALRRLGHEVHVFTLCHHVDGEIHTEKNGFHVHIAGYRKIFKLCFFDGQRVESERLKKMIRAWPCDIYNAHWQYEFARPVVELGVPHLVTVRDNPWKVLWLFRPKLYRLMRLFLAYHVLGKAKNVSVASPYMADYLRRFHGVKQDIPIIPNAVQPFDIGRLQRMDKDKVVFVEMANGFSDCKNVKRLLRAFAILRSKESAVELRLYGTGYGLGEECERWAKRHHCEKGVVFRGRMLQSEMHREIAARGDVFVHSSREESFGAVIVEAMSCGLATIVGKKSGACPWVAGNGETGLLVDVDDAHDIAHAMQTMCENQADRVKFGRAGRRRADEVFALEAVTRQYEALYKEIIALYKMS